MKKRNALCLLLVLFLTAVGCGLSERYRVTVQDGYSTVNDLAPSYRAGEEVTIKLPHIFEQHYVLSVNGETIPFDRDRVNEDYIFFTFIMPSEDVIIAIEEVSVDIPPSPSHGVSIDEYGCGIEYLFGSIEDLEKYIMTGSRDENDYLKAPSVDFSDMPDTDLSERYISPIGIFGIDEKQFSYREASFQFDDDRRVMYRFYLDNVYILIKEVKENTMEEDITDQKTNLNEKNMILYETIDKNTNGYAIRTIGDTNVIYYVEGGIKKTAIFYIEGFQLWINGTAYSTAETIESDYLKFITEDRTKKLALLFGEESDTVKWAIDGISAYMANRMVQ